MHGFCSLRFTSINFVRIDQFSFIQQFKFSFLLMACSLPVIFRMKHNSIRIPELQNHVPSLIRIQICFKNNFYFRKIRNSSSIVACSEEKEFKSNINHFTPNFRQKITNSTSNFRQKMASSASNPTPHEQKGSEKLKILLFIPNMIDYFRLLLLFFAFTYFKTRNASIFVFLYVFNFVLDGVDGILARRLNQVSAFGSFLDVCIDNIARSLVWSEAIPGYVGMFLPCIEWMVFVCTHANGGKAWKDGCFVNAPSWVTDVFDNGFKNPIGSVVIFGLHFFPLWLWMKTNMPSSLLSSAWLGLVIGSVLGLGRFYCLIVELWTLNRHVSRILSEDVIDKYAK